MKQQTEFSAKGRALEQLLLKYGAGVQEIDPVEYYESLELSDNELKKLYKLSKKDPKAFQKEMRKKSESKYIDVPIDEFFEVMKKLNL